MLSFLYCLSSGLPTTRILRLGTKKCPPSLVKKSPKWRFYYIRPYKKSQLTTKMGLFFKFICNLNNKEKAPCITNAIF